MTQQPHPEQEGRENPVKRPNGKQRKLPGKTIAERVRPLPRKRSSTSEYRLVLYMLATLAVLVLAVLLVPPLFSSNVSVDLKELLEYRRTILAVIVTAFGAWVGAGAAYFFGRENLREAMGRLLEMREPSAKERLRRTPVRDIPPKPLDWRPAIGDSLQTVYERLGAHKEYWFIPVFESAEHARIKTVIHEEAFWRYLYFRSEGSGFAREDREQFTLQHLLEYIGEDDSLSCFVDIEVNCTMEQSAADVYRRMQIGPKDRRIAIVQDEAGKPTHFFTTTEVRQLLLDVA